MDTSLADWERALVPWRRWSAGIALVQLPLIPAGFVLLFRSEIDLAAVVAVAYALLEGLKWGIEREALRRNPEADFEPFYRSVPLTPRQRTFLKIAVLAAPFEVIALGVALAHSFDLDLGTTALFVGVFSLSWIVPLERVRRKGSWLAMTRLPGRPRRIPDAPKEEPHPVTRDERTRGRKVLRWFLIVLLPFAIFGLLVLLIALVSEAGGNSASSQASSYIVNATRIDWPEAARRFIRADLERNGGTLEHMTCGHPGGAETSCTVTW